MRPQIYVHPFLDLVPPQSMGSLLRSLWRERREVWSEGAGGLGRARPDSNNRPDGEIEGGLGSTYGGCGRFGGLFGGWVVGVDRMSVGEGAVSDLLSQQLRAQIPAPAYQSLSHVWYDIISCVTSPVHI